MAQGNLEFNRGDIIASRYEVVDRLEESPLGITYRVKHQKSGKFVRLTMMRPKIAGRDQKDAVLEAYRKVKDIGHSSLIKYGELNEHEGVAYFTAEDFEGQTLRQLIAQYKSEGRSFELKEAAQITVQILDGLAFLHERDLMMRGLRPEHILINARQTGPRGKNFVARVKLMNHGFSDLVPAGVLAEDEFGRGEAQYMAPELKSFEPIATPRSDVYSAGVIFYELLTGTAPVGTYQAPCSVRPELPKFANDIAELALANSPDDRYQTTQDFQNALQRTLVDADVGDDEKRPLMTPMGWALGAGFVIACGVIFWQLKPDPGLDDRRAQAEDTRLRNEVHATIDTPDKALVAAVLEKAPPNMVYIPGGKFIRGRLNYDLESLASEPLAQEVDVKPFLIDRFEYPNQKGATPAKDVDWKTAEQMCEENGERLCSDLEWEKACKGPANSIYGYESEAPADTFDASFCGDGLASRGYPSGSLDKCHSNYGVFDMSGNYREWTATAAEGKDTRRIVKGGVRGNSARGTRCAFETDELADFKDGSMGFRCCRDIDAPPWAPPTAGTDPTTDPKTPTTPK